MKKGYCISISIQLQNVYINLCQIITKHLLLLKSYKNEYCWISRCSGDPIGLMCDSDLNRSSVKVSANLLTDDSVVAFVQRHILCYAHIAWTATAQTWADIASSAQTFIQVMIYSPFHTMSGIWFHIWCLLSVRVRLTLDIKPYNQCNQNEMMSNHAQMYHSYLT